MALQRTLFRQYTARKRRISLVPIVLTLGIGACGSHAEKTSSSGEAVAVEVGEIAFQANTGALWIWSAAGGVDTGLGMMAGTSPSIAALSGGGYQVAFQASTGHLWTAGSAGTTDLGFGMMAGTSPSIAGLATGGYEIAFQANTGHLWTTGSGGTADDGLGMMPGTSPSITALAQDGFQIAYQANTGFLWTTGKAGTGDLGLGMMGGTSPSIAGLANGGYVIAFQANTGSLWQAGSPGTGDLGLGMMRGTSPSVTAAGNAFSIAYQANTGFLWLTGSAGTGNRGLGMMAGTSPSIASANGGFSVAFQANTKFLWATGSAANGDLGFGMMPGTSPALAVPSPLLGQHDCEAAGDLDSAGNADSTAGLQRCIDSTPAGGVAMLKNDGTYRVAGKVLLAGGRTLAAPNAATVLASSHQAGLRFPDIPNAAKLRNVVTDHHHAVDEVDVEDYVIPKQPVIAFQGTSNQYQPVYHVTNYVDPKANRTEIYQVFGSDPTKYVKKLWASGDGYQERFDTLQWYKFDNGTALPPLAKYQRPYEHTATEQYFAGPSCKPKGASFPLTWTRTIADHWSADMGGNIGFQDLIRVDYHHPSDSCSSGFVHENMVFSSSLGQLQWFAVCDGETTPRGYRYAQEITNDPVLPDTGIDCTN